VFALPGGLEGLPLVLVLLRRHQRQYVEAGVNAGGELARFAEYPLPVLARLENHECSFHGLVSGS